MSTFNLHFQIDVIFSPPVVIPPQFQNCDYIIQDKHFKIGLVISNISQEISPPVILQEVLVEIGNSTLQEFTFPNGVPSLEPSKSHTFWMDIEYYGSETFTLDCTFESKDFSSITTYKKVGAAYRPFLSGGLYHWQASYLLVCKSDIQKQLDQAGKDAKQDEFNRRSIKLNVLAIILSILGLIVAIFSLWFSISKPGDVQPQTSQNSVQPSATPKPSKTASNKQPKFEPKKHDNLPFRGTPSKEKN
jgi:hypothetical protein